MGRVRSMRSIADGMRWPLALVVLLLALVGFWSVRGGSSPGPSGVGSNEPSPTVAVCLDSEGNRVACTPRDVSGFDLFSGRAGSGVAYNTRPWGT